MTKDEVTQLATICADAFEELQRPPWRGRGYAEPIDKTSGVEAQPCPGFACTRHELEQLATYWYRVALRISQHEVVNAKQAANPPPVPAEQQREMLYADERIDEIWRYLGEARAARIANEVADELASFDSETTHRQRSHWLSRLVRWFK